MKDTTHYANNARTTLMADILTSSTTLIVNSAAGFPTISAADDHFFVTLDDGNNIEIVKVRGISGNTFINCQRGQEGTTAFAFLATTKVENRLTAGNISRFSRLEDRLYDLALVSDLESPLNTNGNSRLIAELDPQGNPIVAVKKSASNLWRFPSYSQVCLTGVVGAAATTTSISLSNVASLLKSTHPADYIIQFTSGTSSGRCRIISVGAGVISFSALPQVPGPADTYEIYRSNDTYLSPTGGGSDKVFFENESNVWFNYSIPIGRNAVSAGPIIINPGVTVTVPSGSSWSIV